MLTRIFTSTKSSANQGVVVITLKIAICVKHTPIQFLKILSTIDANTDSGGAIGPIIILQANNGWKNI